jgi:sigma-B regulation protein RsbU (phosphoserine phosphatase)
MVLPHSAELSSVADLDVAAFMSPADEVGGDYYDFLPAPGGLVKIGIGDVSGHGLQSGVVMLMVQTAVRTLWLSGLRDREQFLGLVNRLLFENIQRLDSHRSMTLSLLDYHGDGHFSITGQHEEMLILRTDGEVERMDTVALGMPLALDLEIEPFLATIELQLAPGECLLLHTDGITEAENPARELYGLDRLAAIAGQHRALDAAAMVQAIIADVEAFMGTQAVFDDITLMVIKRR